MKSPASRFLLLWLFLWACTCFIPENYTKASTPTLVPNIRTFAYSHDQRILVVIRQDVPSAFYVFDGIRLSNPKFMLVIDQIKMSASPSAIAFNHDDSLLVIGTEEGSVFGYKVVNFTISPTWSYKISYGAVNQFFSVRSISIDPNDKIAISVRNHTYVLTVPIEEETAQFNQIFDFEFAHLVQSVCWSVVEPKAIIVGTIGELSGNFSLVYTDTKTQKQINTDNTLSIALSPDGNTIYKSSVGNSIDVYFYQSGEIPKFITSIPSSNSSTFIQVSGDGKYVAAVVNGRVMSWRVVIQSLMNLKMQTQTDQNLQLTFTLNLNETGTYLAVSQTANDILIIAPNENSDQISHFTLCQGATYFNSDPKDCLSCSQNCATCFTAQICISCNNDKFIDGDICSKCNTKLNGCMTCQSSEQCLTCDTNQNWNQKADHGKCTCKDNFYDKNDVCSECNVFVDCINCSGQDYCTLCKDEGNFDTEPVGGKCQCKTSFWLNSNECIECSKSISDCIDCSQDGKRCTKCESSDKRPSPDQQKCECIEYKYEDETGQCQPCDQYQNCIQCQPEGTHLCIKCDKNKSRKQAPESGKCVCMDGFYDNLQGSCIMCSEAIPDCQTCKNDETCLTCKNQSHFNPDPFGGKCICLDGWILVNISCESCSGRIIGCSICSSTTVCTTCNEDAHFAKSPTPEGKCVCKQSYWLNVAQCKLCSQTITGCDQCSTDGSRCLSCQDPNRQPNQAGSACDCKDYYYEDQNNNCQLCDQKQSCLHCNKTDPNHKCIECDSKNHWNATTTDGVCKCITGYNEYDGKCVLCSVPGCVKCQTQKTCIGCDPSKDFIPTPDHDTCNCIPGTYKSDDKLSCLNCKVILGCKQCSNAADCTLCDDSKHFIQNSQSNKCDCMELYYLKNGLTCELCNLNITHCVSCLSMGGTSVECTQCEKGYGTSSARTSCVDCSLLSDGCVDCTDRGHCTKCDEDAGFVLKDNLCVCKPGLYMKDKICLPCSSAILGCLSCESQSYCTSCTNQSHFNPVPDKSNKCSCVQEWTLSGGECKSCSLIQGCLLCSDLDTCVQCDASTFFELTTENKCQCKPKYWQNGTICLNCQLAIYDCELCSKDGKTCDSCADPNRQLNTENTLCLCKQFTYEDQTKKCQSCDPYQTCIECSPQTDHKCQKCNSKNFWNQQPNSNGTCTCQLDYTEFNHSCIQCQVTGCNQCQQANTCFQCQTQKRFIQRPVDGKCQCQINTIFDTDRCYSCNQKLVGCMNCDNLTECAQCDTEHFFVFDDNQKCKCDSYHYLVSTQCKECSEGIKYCEQCIIEQDTKQCSKCKKGFEPSDDQDSCLNCEELIVGCIDCLNITACQQCDGPKHFVFNQDQTQCICNTSFFLQNRDCINCSQPIKGCLDCNQDGTKCSKCDTEAHFAINQVSKKCDCVDGYFFKTDQCLNCSSLLPGCQSCTQNGSKCITCSQGYFLQQSQCFLCSSTIAGCSKCNQEGSKCSQCNKNFILNQKTQKCDCISTYFLNGSQCSLCQNKFIGCSICNPNQCVECNPDHFVYNNETQNCNCQDSYYLNATEKKCALCSSNIAGCQNCSQDGTTCKECNDKAEFVLNNQTKKCLCKEGFFLEEGFCSLCSSKHFGCSKCSQQGAECSQCNANANLIFDSTTKLCSCKPSYYVASNTECKLCSQTIAYCVSCQSNPSVLKGFTPQCQQCQDTFELNPAKSSCNCPGKDKEIVDGKCVDKETGGWVFYAAIGGGALLLIGIGVFAYIKCKKARSRVQLEEELQEGEENLTRSKKQTLLTSQENSNYLKSSGSLDIDQ